MHKCYRCGLPAFGKSEVGTVYAGPICACWFQSPANGVHVDLPRYLPEFKPSPPDAAKCRPAVPLTEEDVRRIVRDELAKGGA